MRDRLLPAAMLVILAATSPALAGESVRPLPPEFGRVQLAAAEGPQTAAIFPGSPREARIAPLPRPLSDGDAEIYRAVLALQDRGEWDAAARQLARVDDDLLRGHVQARRLLADSVTPHYADLKAWLAAFSDLPQAGDIFQRAQDLRPGKKAHGLRSPVRRPALRGTGIETEADGAMWETAAFDTDAASSRAGGFKGKLRQALRDGADGRAAATLAAAAKAGLSSLDLDRLRLMVASDHFAGGRDAPAAEIAEAVAARSGEALPAAHWVAGLALWRGGKPEQARRHFEAAANNAVDQDWLEAAAAFWAGRANLVARRPEAVNHWMEIAASYPRTFYGLLAGSWLGYQQNYSWEMPPFLESDADALMRLPAARRALALVQIGQTEAAEDELRKLYPAVGRGVRQSMMAMAQEARMPELALRLGGQLPRDNGRIQDAAAYPVPDWTPRGGWQIDRALILSLARQESAFNPDARSPSGAAGLMQLMPATAQAMGAGRAPLTDPAVNLALGQRYVARLLADDSVGGNLMMMAAAYNAGPGTLGRWMQGLRHGDDPLMFVESLPARETRVFVQRVMTSYWIYQARMGQPSASLEAMAGGAWPLYVANDRAMAARAGGL